MGGRALPCMYPIRYTPIVIRFEATADFDQWLSGLRDRAAKARIIQRIESATSGNFGDCAPVGEGVSEMRIHTGPGYRIYFTRIGSTVYLLLAGGDKASQPRDIKRALAMVRTLKE